MRADYIQAREYMPDYSKDCEVACAIKLDMAVELFVKMIDELGISIQDFLSHLMYVYGLEPGDVYMLGDSQIKKQVQLPIDILKEYHQSLPNTVEEKKQFKTAIDVLDMANKKYMEDTHYLSQLYDSLCPGIIPENEVWSSGYYKENDKALKDLIDTDWDACLGCTEEELRKKCEITGKKDLERILYTLDRALNKEAKKTEDHPAICLVEFLDPTGYQRLSSVLFEKFRFQKLFNFIPDKNISAVVEGSDFVIYGKGTTGKTKNKKTRYVIREAEGMASAKSLISDQFQNQDTNYIQHVKDRTKGYGQFVKNTLKEEYKGDDQNGERKSQPSDDPDCGNNYPGV